MKKSNLLSTAALSCVLGVAPLLQAAEADPVTEAKQAGILTSSFITGGIAGGPLGAIAGVLAGAWVGEQVKAADSLEELRGQLELSRQHVKTLSEELSSLEAVPTSIVDAALEPLQLALLFKTGKNALEPQARQRLNFLANFLQQHPEVLLRLDGYSDPRGGEAFNQALSAERVKSVMAYLQEQGIDPSRMELHSHGASQSSAATGDYDSYALERVVTIQLQNNKPDSAIAKADTMQ